MLLTSPSQPTGSSFDGNDASLRYNLTFDLPEENIKNISWFQALMYTYLKRETSMEPHNQSLQGQAMFTIRTWIHQQNNTHKQEIIFCNDLKSCNHSMLGISK